MYRLLDKQTLELIVLAFFMHEGDSGSIGIISNVVAE
jgi:hypothetical protein